MCLYLESPVARAADVAIASTSGGPNARIRFHGLCTEILFCYFTDFANTESLTRLVTSFDYKITAVL